MNPSPQDSLRPEELDVFNRLRPDAHMKGSGAPLRHLAATLRGFPEWDRGLAALKARIGTGFLVLLTGDRAIGKTQMGVELIRTMADRDKPARYTTLTRFLMAIKATYRRDSDKSEGDIMKFYRNFPLLVIDEISKARGTEWEEQLLYELINSRYGDMTDTLLITNATTEQLKRTGDSLLSRLQQTGGIIECNWRPFA